MIPDDSLSIYSFISLQWKHKVALLAQAAITACINHRQIAAVQN